MHGATLLLESGLLLGVVAISGLLFRRLGLSTIPAYILLGLLLNPVMGRSGLVDVFAIWGVVLLLFFVGLEFSLGTIVAGRARLFRLGLIDLIINLPVGFVMGLLLGWGVLGGLFIGGAFYVSSSAIIARGVIELRRTAYPETEPALNILVFEDLAIAVLLALLSGTVLGQGDLRTGLSGAASALLFFAAVVFSARLARRWIERALEVDDDDLFLLLVGAILLLIAWAGVRAGVSEAIGAFLAGSVLGETRHRRRIESLFAPLQGLFAALFFLAFGLSVDLSVMREVWPAALVLAAVGIPAKVLTGWFAGRSDGLSPRASLALGLTLMPRGEFSIVLAGVAAAAGYRRAPAMITLFVLLLAIFGTLAMQHAPALTRMVVRPKPAVPMAEKGFDPRLAAHHDDLSGVAADQRDS